MRRTMLLAGLALALMPAVAGAADLPVPVLKAPAAVPGYPYAGAGLIFGLGTEGAVANATAAAPGASTSLYAAGADINFNIGYQGTLGGGSNWWVGDVKVAYQNLGGTEVCGIGGTICSVNSKFDVEERFLIGFPVSTVLAILPAFGNIFPALPAQPAGVVTNASHPYVGVGLHESPVSGSVGGIGGKSVAFQPAMIVGMKNQWTAGLVVNTWAEYSFANTSFSLGNGIGSANQGATARVGVSFEY